MSRTQPDRARHLRGKSEFCSALSTLRERLTEGSIEIPSGDALRKELYALTLEERAEITNEEWRDLMKLIPGLVLRT